jgi:phosphoenolpyruvate-protein phosphotransferase (PTS system enzyme I)
MKINEHQAMKKGVPVSPGVAVAPAYCVDEVLVRREPQHLDDRALSGEIQCFENALAAAGREMDAIVERVRRQVGEEEAAIFRSHRLLLRDPGLVGKVKNAITQRHVDTATALHETLDEYTELFSKIEDEYFKERLSDLRDVVLRILAQIALQTATAPLKLDEPVIIVAKEVLPSQALAFERLPVAGIVTEMGGATGHAAILARSLNIPAVAGMRGILRDVKTGDLLVVDGREGHVYIRPGPEIESAYRKLQREYVGLRDRLIENRDQEPVSADGVQFELLANVNSAADAAMAVRVGASGVGLFRTEYIFLTHPSVPTEEEQVAAYRAVVEAAPNRSVTIRTLDLGGDKNVPYLGHQREANPFMGWRSIRLMSAYPDFFQTQLRAILRTGLFGDVSMMFPMISTVEEVQRLKKMVERTCRSLRRDGIPFKEDMRLGIMLEVPASALCIHSFLDEVDFVSIGSNDLTQYLMAADRDNPKVAYLCEPFNPALLQVLRHVITACNERDTPVTLCGEMGGRPRCFLPLFGLGLRSLSMSPAFVPSIKELVRLSNYAAAEETARRVMKMKTSGEIRGYLTRKVRKIWPNVSMLDMNK